MVSPVLVRRVVSQHDAEAPARTAVVLSVVSVASVVVSYLGWDSVMAAGAIPGRFTGA